MAYGTLFGNKEVELNINTHTLSLRGLKSPSNKTLANGRFWRKTKPSSPRYPYKNLSKPARLLQIQEINPWVPKPCYVDLTETMKGLLQRL